MLDRAIFLINILVGSCGGVVLFLWIVASIALFISKHPRDSWDATIAAFAGVTLVALFVIVPVGSWLYIVGFFS